jgi:hypothetical protein
LKFTRPPAPTENEFQLMIARLEVWLMLSVPACGAAMVAAPCVTLPPVGSVCASDGAGASSAPLRTKTAHEVRATAQIDYPFCRFVMSASCHSKRRRLKGRRTTSPVVQNLPRSIFAISGSSRSAM